jgi:hypothetical protein
VLGADGEDEVLGALAHALVVVVLAERVCRHAAGFGTVTA